MNYSVDAVFNCTAPGEYGKASAFNGLNKPMRDRAESDFPVPRRNATGSGAGFGVLLRYGDDFGKIPVWWYCRSDAAGVRLMQRVFGKPKQFLRCAAFRIAAALAIDEPGGAIATPVTGGFGRGKRREMYDLLDRLISGPRDLLRPVFTTPANRPPILAITADLRLYASVLSAADSFGWGIQWARTMQRGLEICWSMLNPIVIYDRDLPKVDWGCALELLVATASHGRVLLAASSIDEDLWRIVLRRRGYDVISKPAGAEQVKRELRFAWLSMQNTNESEVESSVGYIMART